MILLKEGATMENKLSILLVEDDIDVCNEITKYIDTLEDVVLVGVTNNSTKAIEHIKDNFPHALILDLELHQGYGNGLLVLEELKSMMLPIKPYVLVTTNNSSSTTYDMARTLGADFIMSKHQNNYSSQGAVDFLRMTKNVILSQHTHKDHKIEETPANREKRIIKRMHAELYLVGLSPKLTGFNYIVDGVVIMVEGPTTNICGLIAAKNNKTEPSVERAMQNAINKAWRKSAIEDLLVHYTAKINSDKGVPTITEFICYYANKLRGEY